MAEPLRILMVSTEVVPYAKTGGLADMVPALARHLASLGHEVKIIMPRYYFVERSGLEPVQHPLDIRLGNSLYAGRLWRRNLEQSDVEVLFVDYEGFFGRDGIYGTPAEGDYSDNLLRFACFSRSVFAACRLIHWIPQVIHAHDWPTAPVLAYLKLKEDRDAFAGTTGVMTIHNVGYQGSFPTSQFQLLDLPWSEYRPGSFEFYDKVNFLQGGLRHADMITTVSPRYAEEIRESQYGYGMEGILKERESRLTGILNGADYAIWNPADDPRLAWAYDLDTLESKAINKRQLQKICQFPQDPSIPVVGMVSRMVSQKGFVELVAPGFGALPRILADFPVQVVVLGSGERWCEDELLRLEHQFPNLKVTLTWAEDLAHQILGGADFFLMPSLYEPCGLTQMYALRYGTIPLVSPSGGLMDTVIDPRLDPARATGFYLESPIRPETIHHGIKVLLHYWKDRKSELDALRARGMAQRFSWNDAAQRYVGVYRKALRYHDMES